MPKEKKYARSVAQAWKCALLLAVAFAFTATAQSGPPPVSYFRSVVNDLPTEPLVTVTISGASNVSCLSIEEDLPSPAFPVSVSGDGVWLPSMGAIRWGPYFNITSTNVSYRLAGPDGSYPVNGGSWMDGKWFFTPGITMVAVQGLGAAPSPPPQVATPVFAPASGGNAPVDVIISCATPGAMIYYTLDGSLPTTNSLLYTSAVFLSSASTMRAAGFTNGWRPSQTAAAFYGLPPPTANAQVARSVTGNSTSVPTITFTVTPGTNASCLAVIEKLPMGLSAANVTTGGNYIATSNAIMWGPFFGTNAQVLSYQAVGAPGSYSVSATWSVDGLASAPAATNIVVTSPSSNLLSAPSQVATPTFSPVSGSGIPADVSLSCATPGATIYYTLDGSLPTQASTLYGAPIHLASAGEIRAVGFTNGWAPSVGAVAFYGPAPATANAQVSLSVNTNSPAAPVVTFNVTPGAGASCVAATAWLPPGLAAIDVTAGGIYIASNNIVQWGPFFGTNSLALSYVPAGQPGSYPVQITWSVDGIGGAAATTSIVLAPSNAIPTPPPQEPMPELSPSLGTNLPVEVTISSSDGAAEIYFTTDGSLPTQSSIPYTSPLTLSAPATLRAVAFRPGYSPSVAASGFYVAALPTNSLSLVRSVSGNGTVLPSVTIGATPVGNVSCYSVTETILPGLTPSGLASDAVWSPANNTINWGPYFDHQSRLLTYQLSGPGGTFPLAGQGSFDGHTASVTGMTALSFNPAFIGEPVTNAACVTEPLSYTVDINPGPGIIVDTAQGTVDWGDGTETNITQPVVTLQKLYDASGSYTVTLSVSWTGHTTNTVTSGNGTKTDTIDVFFTCGGPAIISEPANEVVLAGGTAQFTVGANSDFPLTYQWYFNQTNPISSPANFPTLTLPNVTSAAAGSYSVVVTNAYGSTNSTTATLTVVTPLITSVARNENGSVTLNFEGLANTTTRIWAATNLASPSPWQPIFTNTTTSADGAWQFTDTNAIGLPARFYQFSTP